MAMIVIGLCFAKPSASRGNRWVKRASSAGAVQAGAACAWARCAGACSPISIAATAAAPAPAQRRKRRAMSAALRGRRRRFDRAGNESGKQPADAVVDPFGGVGVLAGVIKIEGAEFGPMLHQRKAVKQGHVMLERDPT